MLTTAAQPADPVADRGDPAGRRDLLSAVAVGPWVGCALFSLAGVTDWLDGQLARAWQQQSELGRFLDPIADKLLVAATLFMLAAMARISRWRPSCRRWSSCAARSWSRACASISPAARPRAGLAPRQMEDRHPDGRDRRAAGRRCRAGRAAGARRSARCCCGSPRALTIVTGYDYLRAGLIHIQDEAPAIRRRASRAAPREDGAMRIFGLAGWSGSGKTTLVVRLLPALIARGVTVSTVKHAHHDFDIDQPGKDSWRHREAGATRGAGRLVRALGADARASRRARAGARRAARAI